MNGSEESKLKNTMDSTETKLLSQIVTEFKHNCKYFFSEEDCCIYFIFEDMLYGYTVIRGLEMGEITFIWSESETDYSIGIDPKNNKERLTKKQTKQYTVLDYTDLVHLYSRLNASRHLNNKNNMES